MALVCCQSAASRLCILQPVYTAAGVYCSRCILQPVYTAAGVYCSRCILQLVSTAACVSSPWSSRMGESTHRRPGHVHCESWRDMCTASRGWVVCIVAIDFSPRRASLIPWRGVGGSRVLTGHGGIWGFRVPICPSPRTPASTTHRHPRALVRTTLRIHPVSEAARRPGGRLCVPCSNNAPRAGHAAASSPNRGAARATPKSSAASHATAKHSGTCSPACQVCRASRACSTHRSSSRAPVQGLHIARRAC
jgi:hypothetical protein